MLKGGVLSGVIVASVLAVLPWRADSPVVAASADYSSFFTDPALAGAGWSTCPEPVTWSADVRGLRTKVARREVQRLKEAWSAWSGASGVTFRYVGRESLVFNPVTNNLEAVDGSIRRERHIYVAFKSRQQVGLMTQSTVGLAMPSVVMLPTREIVGGMAVFRRGYVLEQRRVELRRVIQLYLHEFGHVMGLGHSPSPADVMFSQLDERTTLGAGDRSGIAAFTQPCAT